MLDAFAAELGKIARASKARQDTPARRRAREVAQAAAATSRGAVAGAALPIALTVFPWMASRRTVEAEIGALQNREFLEEYIKNFYKQTGRAKARGVGEIASEIQRTMRLGPSPEATDVLKMMRVEARDPIVLERFREVRDALRQHGFSGEEAAEASRRGVSSMKIPPLTERIPSMKDLFPRHEDYRRALAVGEKSLGSRATSPNKLYARLLGQRLRGSASAAVPLAMLGGGTALYYHLKRKKEHGALEGQK